MPDHDEIPPDLPSGWPTSVQQAILQVIALAGYVFVRATGLVMSSGSPSGRRAARADQTDREIVALREELRIKNARMASIPAARRPQYDPCERLAILELKAARNWSLAHTARVFLVTAATIASWTRRLDEGGPEALLQTREPVNKFPDFVRHIVQRLQALCPSLGKVKIAEILARAGLHLAVSTVGRIRREPAAPEPQPTPATEPQAAPEPQTTTAADAKRATKRVTAKCPNHVWHVDLTAMPIFSGLCAPWLPFALPACFPLLLVAVRRARPLLPPCGRCRGVRLPTDREADRPVSRSRRRQDRPGAQISDQRSRLPVHKRCT